MPGPWSLGRRIAVVALVAAAFALWYILSAPSIGRSAAAPVAFVLLAAGYLLGVPAGIAVGLLIMPGIWALGVLLGLPDPLPSFGAGVFYVAVMALLGAVGGGLGRLQSRAERSEREIRQLTDNLRQTQSIAKLGYWSIWSDGQLHWSKTLWQAFGFTVEPVDVEQAFDRIHPDDEPVVRAHVDAAWKDGTSARGEHRVVLPDGTLRWIAYTCDAERDAQAAVVRVFGTGQDITERKRAEETGARFRDLLERLDDVYWVGDPAKDQIEYSGGVRRVFGYSAQELSVDPSMLAKKVHPDDLERVAAAIGQVVGGEPATVEFRSVRPDGSLRHVVSRAWPIEGDAQYTAHGTMRDVTPERDLEASRATRLRQAEDFQRLLDNLKDVYFTMDQRGHVHVSAASRQVYGRDPQEFHDDPDLWQKVVLDEDRPITEQALQKVMQGKQVETDVRIHHQDGTVRTVRATVWPRMEDDQVAGAIGVIHDITAEQEVVRLTEMDEMKALLMNSAAHELSTPLTPLRLQASILRTHYPDETGIDVIDRNIDRLQTLVTDLLDASRMQAGRLKYDMQDDIDLSALLGEVADTARAQAQEAGCAWHDDVAAGLSVRADPVRITQVFTNLVNNAIKFTPAGGEVRLTAHGDDQQVTVAIQDTGLGLTAEQMSGLFEPFHQFHRAATGAHKGTGLGLFISKGIVEHHKGRLTASSPGPDKGATFEVRLPCHSDALSLRPGEVDGEHGTGEEA